MIESLKNIATLLSGIYTKSDPDGSVFYVQVRHFDQMGRFDPNLKPELKLAGAIEKHLLQPGDILFSVKGTKNIAFLYQSEMAKAVASSVFMVIRIHDQKIISPEYLQWILNQPQTQIWCNKEARGTNLPSITQVSLENFEFPVPSLQLQTKIVKTNLLMKKEKVLQNQIATLQEYRNQQLLLKSLYSESSI